MARTFAALPAGSRIADYVGLDVVTKAFPLEKFGAALAATGKESIRRRDLPAHVAVYYIIALALYMQSSCREAPRCLLEGIQWLREPPARIHAAGNSGISQASTRLGWKPPRQLRDDVVKPVAAAAAKGAWYRVWRLVSMDGSTLESPARRAIAKPSAVQAPAAANALIPRFVLCRRGRTGLMFYSQPDGGLCRQRDCTGKDRTARPA